MKFGHEVERIAKTPLAVETQLHTALLPYKRLKKQIRHNGCVEPHVDALSDPDMSAPNLPIPGEGGGAAPDVRSSSGGHGGAAAAGGGQLPRTSSAPEVAHLMENSPFLRFLGFFGSSETRSSLGFGTAFDFRRTERGPWGETPRSP